MIDTNHEFSMSEQAKILRIARSECCAYHLPSDETRLSVTAVPSYLLVQQESAQLEAVEHHAC